MHTLLRLAVHLLRATALCFGLLPFNVFAQPHEHTVGEHVLRASTISAANLPESMRRRHSIAGDSGTGVLNVTVQRKAPDGSLRNVPAAVDVQAHNSGGVPTTVRMKEVVADGMVSYLGVYRFLPREVLDFRITARPTGSPVELALEFRDRLWRP